MGKIHEKQPGDTYYTEDYVESWSFVLDNMIRLGLDTGSVTNQHLGSFWFFSAGDSAGSISTMTFGGGSYVCNNALPLACVIQTAVIPVHYQTIGSGIVSHWGFNGPTTINGSDSIGSNHGTLNNIGSDIGKIGSAAVFNNTTSYIRVPADSSMQTNVFTINAWVKPTTRAAGTDPDFVDQIIASDGGADISGGIGMSIDSNGSLHVLLNNGTKRDVNSLQNVALDTYSMVTFTFDGTTMKPYTNGSVGNTFATSAITRNGSPINIGCRIPSASGYEYFFNGSMDEFTYWNRILSATEISELYQEGSGLRRADFEGSVTSAIATWQGSFSSDTTVTHAVSLDNGTTFTTITQGLIGSITPSTGSLISRLTITRAGSNVLDTVDAMGLYYG